VSEDLYTFGPFRFEPGRGLLRDGERDVRIGSRALALLEALVERASEVVPYSDLLSRVWPDTVVDEGNLRVQMVALRKALGDRKDVYIQNVPGAGYRFAATVERHRAEPTLGSQRVRSDAPALLTTLFGREEAIRVILEALTRQRFVPDIEDWDTFEGARIALRRNHFTSSPAARYRLHRNVP
jgi:DNA-binding winged helix-turn-helix (wHTH) protein